MKEPLRGAPQNGSCELMSSALQRNPHFDDDRVVWNDVFSGEYHPVRYQEQFDEQWKLFLERKLGFHQHTGVGDYGRRGLSPAQAVGPTEQSREEDDRPRRASCATRHRWPPVP